LTKDEINRLHATPQVNQHLTKVVDFYKGVAYRVLQAFPEFSEEDRVKLVVVLIKKYDQDVYGLEGKGMSVDDICKIYAASVIGHEERSSEGKSPNG
jgi:hypothetical protein